MKIKHVDSGTEFTRNESGNFTVCKKGAGDYWIAKRDIGFSMKINHVQLKIDKGWFELIEEN